MGQSSNIGRYALALVMVLALPLTTTAQSLQGRMAQNYESVFNYPAAAQVYEDMSEKGKASHDDLRRLAKLYVKMGKPVEAEGALQRLVAMGNTSPEDVLQYADALRANAKYDEALVWYNTYDQTVPGDARARNYLDKPQMLQQLVRDSTRQQVRQTIINSEQADLGVAIMDDLLLFSSARGQGAGGKRKYNWDHEPFLNLYTAVLRGSKPSEATVLRKDLNSRYHDGTASYDSVNHRLYFTRNNVFYGAVKKATDGEVKLGIFYSDIVQGETGTREWGTLVPFEHNPPEHDAGHPFATRDGRYLFFVSDMPGGLGGTDIWYCENLSNQWGTPVNMGVPVNTPGNEMFPFLARDSSFFFSSNGHAGLGGMDIFHATLTSTGAARVQNMGYPLNTRYNDHNLALLADDSTGFFVSDRPGGLGSDDIYGCTVKRPGMLLRGIVLEKMTDAPVSEALIMVKGKDGRFLEGTRLKSKEDGTFVMDVPFQEKITIVATKNGYLQKEVVLQPATDAVDNVVVELLKYDFGAEGTVYKGETDEPVPGAKVFLVDLQDKVIAESISKEDGKYALPLQPNTDYRIKVEKEGYFKQSARITTKGKANGIIHTDFRLIELELDKIVRLENIYYDLGKATLRPQALVELDKLIQTLLDNPTVKIELSSHSDCRGKDAFNLTLSEKRAKSAVDYIVKKGIPNTQIVSKGYGELQPIEACECTKCTDDQHQRNRRTEFKVIGT
jgi:outer membrane protein OmpA-like peptidoglycan-associated protein